VNEEPRNGEIALPERAAELATELTEQVPPPQTRRQRLAEVTRKTALSGAGTAGRLARTGGRKARSAAGTGAGWLSEQTVAMVPRLKVRDQAALQAQFPGQSPDQIAEALISGAARASSAAGAAAGAWAVLPVVASFPAEVAAETLVVVGIEVKLVAELHEAFGVRPDGNKAERARSYLAAWAQRRGVFLIPGGVVFAPGSPLARLLRRRLIAKAGRSTASLGPLLTGAVAGAMLNGTATRKLGRDVLADLRRHQITGPARV
jgi:hypothetical protein